jgi:hypothetical protein
MPIPLSFVYCAAYDWRLLPFSVASIWEYADEVILGIDKNRRTWTGGTFTLDTQEVLAALAARGCQGPKIVIVEEDFWRDGDITPLVELMGQRQFDLMYSNPVEHPVALKLETMQRNRLSHAIKSGNFGVSIDCDEVALDMPKFHDWFQAHQRPFMAHWVNIYKIIGDTAIVVDKAGTYDLMPIGFSGVDKHRRGRLTEAPYYLISPLQLLHFTLGGRTRDEIEQKLQNWGHAGEQPISEFMALWDSVNLDNYTEVKPYGPFSDSKVWSRLKAIPLKELGIQL